MGYRQFMKILHVGGYYTVTSQIVQQHQLLGHDVVWIGGARAEAPFEMPNGFTALARAFDSIIAAGFNVVQVHQPSGLLAATAEESIRIFTRLKDSGSKLFYYAIDGHVELIPISHFDISEVLRRTPFSHIFRGWVHIYGSDQMAKASGQDPLTSQGIPWSWLAPALPIEEVSAQPWQELNPLGVRLLHIPYATTPADTAAIARNVESLKAQSRLKFDFRVCPPESLASRQALDEALLSCDVYVESLHRESPGLLAYEAMLRGKMVLSGNSSEAQAQWQQLVICPVMHSTPDNLAKRIESIVREPRCLRDLSKRSREYVELYHDPNSMAEKTLTVYQQSL